MSTASTVCIIVVFFIFLVANIGGSLTPSATRRCSSGFLKGVSFLLDTVHLFCKTVLLYPSSCSASIFLLGYVPVQQGRQAQSCHPVQ